MKRFVLTLAWVLWAHEMAVGDRLVDRGYTAVDSFETRQQCHAAPWPTTPPSSWFVRAR